MAGSTGPTGIAAARDLALVAMIAWLTAGPAAQGLADIARRSTGREPGVPGRTYTNADVEPARPAEPAATPASEEPATTVPSGPAGQTEKAPAAPTAPVELTEEEKALQERRAAHARKFADELGARLQQRQGRVQALRREWQDLQRAHALGDPAATAAARDALQQRLAEAERELGSAQRAVSRAEAQNKDAAAAGPPPRP